MTNLDSILKSRDITLSTKVCLVGYGFSSSHVWMWELDYKENWALKNWCFWTVVLEKTLESPLDCKEIQSVHPKGNQWADVFERHSLFPSVQFNWVQSHSHFQLFATPWIAARQASLSITNSRSPPKPMSIESVLPSNHLILCHPLLLMPPIFLSIRVFSNESALSIRWPKYWSFSYNRDTN